MQPLPLRPCVTACKTVLRYSHIGGVRWHKSTRECSTGARRKDTSRWSKDLSEVLLEPEMTRPLVNRRRETLQDWQLQKLQAAAETGKHKVKVHDLAQELNLPRPKVLEYIKTYRTERHDHTAQNTAVRDLGNEHLQPKDSDTDFWPPEMEQMRQPVQSTGSHMQNTQPSTPTAMSDSSEVLHTSSAAPLQRNAVSAASVQPQQQDAKHHPQSTGDPQAAENLSQSAALSHDEQIRPQATAEPSAAVPQSTAQSQAAQTLREASAQQQAAHGVTQASTTVSAAQSEPQTAGEQQQHHSVQELSAQQQAVQQMPQSSIGTPADLPLPKAASNDTAAQMRPQPTAQQPSAPAALQAESKQPAARFMPQATAQAPVVQTGPQSAAKLPASRANPKAEQTPTASPMPLSTPKKPAGRSSLQSAADQQPAAPQSRSTRKHSATDSAPRSTAKQQSTPSRSRAKAHKKEAPLSFAARQHQGTDFEHKRLGRVVEATLEKMFEQSQHPSDDKIDSFLQLHKGVPRYRVIDWFGQRRRMNRR